MTDFLARYLRPGPHCLWRLSDRGRVVTWRDGETVAFAGELQRDIPFLARLARRLPPFPALFLLWAACRHRGAPLPDDRWRFVVDSMQAAAAGSAGSRQLRRMRHGVEACLSALSTLQDIPTEYWDEPRSRPVLAGEVFRHREATPEETRACGQVVDDLHVGPEWGGLVHVRRDERLDELVAGLEELRCGLLALRPHLLLDLLKTGVSELPDAVDLDDLELEHDPPCAPSIEFIKRLEDDPVHGELARLTTRCLAALRVPRLAAHPVQAEPTGDVNLSNRGPLDRLLLSELALDDQTLAQRIALQEALYLERLPSERPLDSDRVILVDTGIRTWGRARLLLTAVAMALGAQAAPQREVRILRTTPSGPVRSLLSRRSGVVDHLAALDPQPRPMACAAQLAEEPVGHERFLVTSSMVLDDPRFAERLRELAGPGLFVVAAAPDGWLELHSVTAAGHRRLWRARVPEDEAPSKAAECHEAEPVSEIPFLLPHSYRRSRCLEVGDGEFVIRATDGRLMYWRDVRRLGEQLLGNAPSAPLYHLARYQREVHMVLGPDRNRSCLHWWVFHLDRRELEQMEIDWSGALPQPGQAVIGHRNLCLMDRRTARVWVMGRPEPASTTTLPGRLTAFDGKIYLHGRRCAARVGDGRLEMEFVPADWEKEPGVLQCVATPAAATRFEQQFAGVLRNYHVRSKWDRIAGWPGGGLVMIRRDVAHRILLGQRCLHTASQEALAPEVAPVPFVLQDGVRVAAWADGSRAVLDRRGILDLRSSDASLPNILIACVSPALERTGGLAAATSDGRRCGPPAVMPDPNCEPAELWDLIVAFGRRLR